MCRGAALAALCLSIVVLPGVAWAQEDRAGRVVEWSTHEPSGVRSAWLSNGVRVHHMPVGAPTDRVVVTIRLFGGAIEEDEGNRGITQAAMAAWEEPRAQGVDLGTWLEGAGIGYEAGVIDADMVGMTLECDAKDLAVALDAAATIIRRSTLDGETLESWRAAEASSIASRKGDPEGVLRELVSSSLFPPGDARVRPLELEDVERIGLEEARAWLSGLASAAPIEMAIVGPVTPVRAMVDAARTMGSLPSRARVSSGTLDAARGVGPRPEGPIEGERACGACADSVALVGFYAPDRADLWGTRAMFASYFLLQQRLLALDWGPGPAPKVMVELMTGRAFPGYGIFYVRAVAPGASIDGVVGRVEAAIDAFAREGPSEAEMATFQEALRTVFARELDNPGFWSTRLVLSTTIDGWLDGLGDITRAYSALEAADIRAVFDAYAVAGNRFELVVRGGGE